MTETGQKQLGFSMKRAGTHEDLHCGRIYFSVNGRDVSATTDPERPLLDVLREDLG